MVTYYTGTTNGESEEEVTGKTIDAIDQKIAKLKHRSSQRFDPSDISETERKELYKKNPRRSSTRFKGLKH